MSKLHPYAQYHGKQEKGVKIKGDLPRCSHACAFVPLCNPHNI